MYTLPVGIVNMIDSGGEPQASLQREIVSIRLLTLNTVDTRC